MNYQPNKELSLELGKQTHMQTVILTFSDGTKAWFTGPAALYPDCIEQLTVTDIKFSIPKQLINGVSEAYDLSLFRITYEYYNQALSTESLGVTTIMANSFAVAVQAFDCLSETVVQQEPARKILTCELISKIDFIAS